MYQGLTLALFLTIVPLSAAHGHGGKTHVMGVVAEVEGRDFVVEDTRGRPVRIRTTPDTQYFIGRLKAGRDDLRAGRRVAVDVFGMKGDYSALEVHLGAEESDLSKVEPDSEDKSAKEAGQ